MHPGLIKWIKAEITVG